ncbi:MAG: hypothetical protein QOC87_1883 [Actinomycetota bacterium]|jgi:hypothetical protein|nr:hypothetical protein [Actinomycetota bacterium]
MKRALCACALGVLIVWVGVAASARPVVAGQHKHAKALFNLSAGYYLAAGAICVGIGAAGGFAYAGIMGPKRRPQAEPKSS